MIFIFYLTTIEKKGLLNIACFMFLYGEQDFYFADEMFIISFAIVIEFSLETIDSTNDKSKISIL